MNRIAERMKKNIIANNEMSQTVLNDLVEQVDKKINFYDDAVERMNTFNEWLSQFSGVEDLKTIFNTLTEKINDVKVYLESNKGNVQKCDIFKKDNGSTSKENEQPTQPPINQAIKNKNRIIERVANMMKKSEQQEINELSPNLESENLDLMKQQIDGQLKELYIDIEKNKGRTNGYDRNINGHKVEMASWWSGTFYVDGKKMYWDDAVEYLAKNILQNH